MTIPGDWVMVKMDIEGAEWDILPCLALAPAASLVDRLFVEIHNQSMGSTGTGTAHALVVYLPCRPLVRGDTQPEHGQYRYRPGDDGGGASFAQAPRHRHPGLLLQYIVSRRRRPGALGGLEGEAPA